MFARKNSANLHLDRYIYSFLVQGDLGLIYKNRRVSDDVYQYPTTLSIIRRINKRAKEATQIWQDKFSELKQYITAHPDPNFKQFYKFVTAPYESDFKFCRGGFITKDVMLTLFERMSQAPTQPLITMLKSVFEECDKWKDCPDQLTESKDVIQNGKFELRKFYVSLNQLEQVQMRASHDTRGGSLWYLQKQFKFLVLERIVYLLFKSDVNTFQKHTNSNNVGTAELPAMVVWSNQDTTKSKQFFAGFLSSILACVLAADFMPEGPRKNYILIFFIEIAIICAFIAGELCYSRRNYLQRNEISQTFRTSFLTQIGQGNDASNQNDKDSPETKDFTAPNQTQNIEVKIDTTPSTSEEEINLEESKSDLLLLSKNRSGLR